MALQQQSSVASACSNASESLLWGLGLTSDSCWQFDLSQPNAGSILQSSGVHAKVQHVRFDDHAALPGHHLSLEWSTQVGVHPAIPLQSEGRPHETPRSAAARAATPVLEPDAEGRLVELLAELAHDIRSPIASASQIIGTIIHRVGAQGQVKQSDGELLRAANSRLLQASNWAEGILLEGSLEQGRPIAIRSRFYPHQWQELQQPMLDSLAAQCGVTLCWMGWERSLPVLYHDVNHLSRALLNLVTNAIQASAPGQRIQLGVAWHHSDPQRIFFTVEDSGSGLSPELTREVNRTRTAASGQKLTHGLGLRTVKSLILSMGGTLTVQCAEDIGTSFRISLPIDDCQLLIRNWLHQNSDFNFSHARSSRYVVEIHAIRACRIDNQFVDTQLQGSASRGNFVYRIAKDRWLWLTLAKSEVKQEVSALRTALHRVNAVGPLSHLPVRTSQVYRSEEFEFDGGHDPLLIHKQMDYLSKRFATKVGELIAGRVPAVDELKVGNSAFMLRPVLNDRGQRLERTDLPSRSKPHGPRSPEPDSKLAEALLDAAHGWQAIQSKLHRTTKVDGPQLLRAPGFVSKTPVPQSAVH